MRRTVSGTGGVDARRAHFGRFDAHDAAQSHWRDRPAQDEGFNHAQDQLASQILVTSYPEGPTIGAPAQVIETGLFQKATGSIPNAGPDVLLGHVVAFTAEGVPIVEFDEVLASHGPRPDFAEAVCAVLDG